MVSQLLTLVCQSVKFAQGSAKTRSDSNPGVVIVEPYGMGDIISLESLVHKLRAAGREISFVGQKRWEPILDGVRWIDAPGSWADLGLSGFIRFCWTHASRLRKQFHGSLGIDPRGDIRTILFLRLAGCTRILSLDHYMGTTVKTSASVATLVKDSYAEKMRWEMSLEFLEALGISPDGARHPRLDHLCAGVDTIEGRIGLVTVAPWAGKLWAADGWKAVVAELRKRSLDPVLICGPGQELAVREQVPVEDIRVFPGANVSELARIVQGCEAIVTLDSGPMHIASALDLPVVALFGTGQIPLWAPFSKYARVVTSPDFGNEQVHQIEENTEIGRRSMNRIGADQVIQALLDVCKDARADGRFGEKLSMSPQSGYLS